MKKPLRVLIVEDSEDDTLLILRELERGGYSPTHRRVDTEKDMRDAVAYGSWEIVLADYNMPHFNGGTAQAMLRRSGLEIPFIIVSGSIGEDTAVAAMKAGAHDYIMKTNLGRLVPAVERELRDAEVRRARRRAEEALETRMKEIEVLNARLAEEQMELATFYDLVTHDVSNFSMTLLAIVERLLSKADGPLTPKQEELLRRANRQGLVVNRLAENAKILARARRQGLSAGRRPVPVAETLRRAVDTLRAMYFDRAFDVAVECGEELEIVGTPFLENVFLNLLDNAVRHSPKERPASVLVKVFEQGGQVHVTFENESTLEKEVQLHLFERYRKGPRSTGAGLGLAVVREIVEGMGGKVSAASRAGDRGGKVEIDLVLPRT